MHKTLPYPENPIIKQYSAEYWILGDLLAEKIESFAKRVSDCKEADVVFVPFFATMSAELQLVEKKSVFRKRVEENEDYMRQRMVVDLVKKTEAWKRSGGRDHVFVLTGNFRDVCLVFLWLIELQVMRVCFMLEYVQISELGSF